MSMINQAIKEDVEKIIKKNKEFLFSLAGKKVLITGGNGFIPSYIVDTLTIINKQLNNPCKLILLNKNPINEKSRLSHLINDSNIEFLSQDVGKPFKINSKIDVIIHAASRANPTSFLENPLDTIDSNVNGLRTLLDFAVKNPVENFIFFSSAEIYGNPPNEFIPTPENYNGNVDCTSKRACYSESKRFCETLCMTYFRKYAVPIKILRIFHTYGPGLRNDGKAITDFFKNGVNYKKILLKDRGESRMTFCYVSDLINAIFLILSKGKSGEVYNVGNDLEDISIIELAKIIGSIIGGVPVIAGEQGNYRDRFKIELRKPDISKLRELGFAPEIFLKEGLFRMYNSLGI